MLSQGPSLGLASAGCARETCQRETSAVGLSAAVHGVTAVFGDALFAWGSSRCLSLGECSSQQYRGTRVWETIPEANRLDPLPDYREPWPLNVPRAEQHFYPALRHLVFCKSGIQPARSLGAHDLFVTNNCRVRLSARRVLSPAGAFLVGQAFRCLCGRSTFVEA